MKPFLAILLLFSSIAYGGKPSTSKVPIKGEGYSATVEAYVSAVSVRTKDHLTYHWLKSKHIHTSEGGYSGFLLHGHYESHYDNGQLKEQGQFKNGLKVGEWKSWHENGKLKEIVRYSGGQLNGRVIKYDENGRTIMKGGYKSGLRHGQHTFFENGEMSGQTNYSKGDEIEPKAPKPKKEKKPKTPKVKKEKKPKEDKSKEKEEEGSSETTSKV